MLNNQEKLKKVFEANATAKIIAAELAARERSHRAPHYTFEVTRFKRYLETPRKYRVDAATNEEIPEMWARTKPEAWAMGVERVREAYKIDDKDFYRVFKELERTVVTGRFGRPYPVGFLELSQDGKTHSFKCNFALRDVARLAFGGTEELKQLQSIRGIKAKQAKRAIKQAPKAPEPVQAKPVTVSAPITLPSNLIVAKFGAVQALVTPDQLAELVRKVGSA